jgi:vacuolar-type H+-ATPase subunit I/STV1
MDIAEFNYIESVLWFIIAIGLLVYSFKLGKSDASFKICLIASVAFVAFGVSDIIEAQTGAWWRPFSLLVLKAICVVTFVLCFFKYKKLQGAKKT